MSILCILDFYVQHGHFFSVINIFLAGFGDNMGHCLSIFLRFLSMFVHTKVSYLALFTLLVGWFAGAVSFRPEDITLVGLVCPQMTSFFIYISGLYYKHITIVNDDSRVITKLETSLTEDARVIIYDRHMLMIQALV